MADTMTATALCLMGETVIGGGYVLNQGSARDNFPSGGPPATGWTVSTTANQTIQAFVICVDTTP
ncbi:hypothetical protein [Streptomyces phaeofaciens]|uniref:hypothetical protein n=1 Tax=Streptomyces phaeofaciens TaxID=68254 RepID=UPI0036A9A778